MTLPDFTNYDDAKLEAARVAVLTELECRANVASIPGQLQALVAAYVNGGGNFTDLTLKPPAEHFEPAAGSDGD